VRSWLDIFSTRCIASLSLTVAVAFGSPLLCPPSSPNFGARAEEISPLQQVAELMSRKGFKNVSLGQNCDIFDLRRRLIDSDCAGYSGFVEQDDPDLKAAAYEKGWFPSFFAFHLQGSSIWRVMLATQNSSEGFSFLVGSDEKLQMAATGVKVPTPIRWHWTRTNLTPDLQTKFAHEIAFWITQRKSLEELPDRKN
jgi:hypothetical protein